jgi:hypothetical protein
LRAHDPAADGAAGSILDGADESQYYTEPKRLARLGYLEGNNQP